MVKPITDAELQLRVRARRRILGAIALVAALVVVLPMVLDSEPKHDAQEIAITIPAPDKAPPLKPPVKPDASADKAVPGTAGVGPAQVKTPANAVSKSADGEPKPSEKRGNKPKTEADKGQTGKPSEPKAAKFVVQVGVFANPENAEQLEVRLKENKIRHYTETLKTPPGAIRVRAGPYANRADAETALTQMKLAGISGGVVVSE